MATFHTFGEQMNGQMQTQTQPGNLQVPGLPDLSHGQSASQSGQYFADPNLVKNISGSLGQTQQNAGADYLNFVNNPTASPYFTNALHGLLSQLAPGEAQDRQSLNDQFRAGGNTSSSTYGHAAQGLESGFDRNRLGIASQLLTTMFPQIAQALYQPMSQTSSLIDALKLNQQSSGAVQQSNLPPQSPWGFGLQSPRPQDVRYSGQGNGPYYG